MLAKDNNTLDYFIYHKKKKFLLGNKKQNIEEDQKDLISKSLDNESIKNMLPRYISQDGLLVNELLSSLKKIRFSKQEFSISTPVSDIKYDHAGSQNNDNFYLFNDQLDYLLAHYFVKSESTKGNVDKFLSNLFIAPLIEKLSYQNIDK